MERKGAASANETPSASFSVRGICLVEQTGVRPVRTDNDEVETMARRDALLRLHKSLLSRRSDILKKLTDELDSLGNLKDADGIGDAADVAFEAGSDEMTSHLAEFDARELSQIERALARLKQGTYGLCESCGGKIPVGRLNALPYSTLCINCQREMEKYPDWRDHRHNWENVYDAATPLEDQREVKLSDIEIDLSSGR
jgi:DnaK suppressor protein